GLRLTAGCGDGVRQHHTAGDLGYFDLDGRVAKKPAYQVSHSALDGRQDKVLQRFDKFCGVENVIHDLFDKVRNVVNDQSQTRKPAERISDNVSKTIDDHFREAGGVVKNANSQYGQICRQLEMIVVNAACCL